MRFTLFAALCFACASVHADTATDFLDFLCSGSLEKQTKIPKAGEHNLAALLSLLECLHCQGVGPWKKRIEWPRGPSWPFWFGPPWMPLGRVALQSTRQRDRHAPSPCQVYMPSRPRRTTPCSGEILCSHALIRVTAG